MAEPSFAQRIIAAHQAGLAERRADEQKVKDEEARKLQMDIHAHQLKSMKLDEKIRQAGLHPQAPEVKVPMAPMMPSQISTSPDLPGDALPNPAPMQQPEGSRSIPMPLPGIGIGPEEGVPNPMTLPVTSMQQYLQQIQEAELKKQQDAMAMKAYESQLKREENTITIPGGIPGLGNKPTAVDSRIAGPLITQAGAAAGRDDTQAATAEQNEAARKATAEQNRLNREATAANNAANIASRLQAAQVAADSRLNAARQGGVATKSITRADAKVREFLGSPTVKKYAEVSEIVDYVKTFDVNTASAADDYTLLVTQAKAVDPGSVAREGEVNAAKKAAQSILDDYGISFESIFNKTRSLTVPARQAIIAAINKKIAPNVKNYENYRQSYVNIIGAIPGMDKQTAADLIPSLSGPAPTAVASGPKAGDVQDGYTFMGGDPADPKNWKKP